MFEPPVRTAIEICATSVHALVYMRQHAEAAARAMDLLLQKCEKDLRSASKSA